MEIVTLSEVKNLLKKLQKDRELTREQNITLEYAEKVVKLPASKTRKLIKELMDLGRINEIQACKLADLLPESEDDVTAIFSKESYTPSSDQIKKILNIIRKYF
jgi:DNA-directed RNA polymerase subunit F